MPIHYFDINSQAAAKITIIVAQNPGLKHPELWAKVKAAKIVIAQPQFNVLLNDLRITNKIKRTVNKEYFVIK